MPSAAPHPLFAKLERPALLGPAACALALAAGFGLCPSRAQAAAANYLLSGDAPGEVRFTVDAPLDSIVGLTRALSGAVTFDPDTLAFGPARVAVDSSSFRTGIGLRDQDLRDQFLETGRFPEIVLSLQRLTRPSAEKFAPGSRLTADLTGQFSLHGVTRTITFTVNVDSSADGSALAVRGNFPVVLADYGIKRPARLFLKLGEVARVDLHANLVRAQEKQEEKPHGDPAFANAPGAAPAPQPTAAPAPPAARLQPKRSLPKQLAKLVKEHREPPFQFAFNTPAGRGERLLSDPSIGGEGNATSCTSCHSSRDERDGDTHDGIAKPSHSLFDVARRQTFWQGFAKTVGKASSLCAKMYMLQPDGLDEGKQKDLEAYLTKLSPDDVVPDLDYRALILTKKTPLARPTGGNAKSGQRLAEEYCAGCHAVGQQRPPLTPGLYEPDYLVQRVRWLPGTDARQMPPMYLDRLTDSELRDIVTYLAGDESQRIFKRKPQPAVELKPDPANAAPAAPPSAPAPNDATKASLARRTQSKRMG